MSLPKGWIKTELQVVGKIVTGKTPSKNNSEFYGGKRLLVKPGDLDKDIIVTSSVDRLSDKGLDNAPSIPFGSVMVTCIGNMGKVGIAGETLATNQQINSIVPNKNLIDSKYLYYYAKTLKEWMDQESSATTISIINKSKFSTAPLLLPPINEQKRIAKKLDELLASVENIKTRLDIIPTIIKRFRQSILAAATSGKLTEKWRSVHIGFENPRTMVEKAEAKKTNKVKVRKSNNLEDIVNEIELPKTWEIIENYRLAKDGNNSICAGPFGTIFKAKDFRDEGVPIIFLRHIGEAEYLTKKPTFMDIKVWKEKHQPYSVYGGELLVSKLGDPPGTACIYPLNIGTAMVTPDVMKMSVDNTLVPTEYLMYFFNSPTCKNMIRELAFGVTRLRIDLTMFKSFPIPLPPREEQKEIVSQVEFLFTLADSLEIKIEAAKKRVDKLTQSILHKAFKGELVPQDPNDEPAEKLLERTKAEQEKEKPKKKVSQSRKFLFDCTSVEKVSALLVKEFNNQEFTIEDVYSLTQCDKQKLIKFIFELLKNKFFIVNYENYEINNLWVKNKQMLNIHQVS